MTLMKIKIYINLIYFNNYNKRLLYELIFELFFFFFFFFFFYKKIKKNLK